MGTVYSSNEAMTRWVTTPELSTTRWAMRALLNNVGLRGAEGPGYNGAMHRSDFIFRYRVRNWRAYNRALVRRGSITFWVDEQAIAGWCQEKVPGTRGRLPLYADTAIECALVVNSVFHLSLRATQGFLESVVDLMGIDLPVPDYTTVCKRQHALSVRMLDRLGMQPHYVVIDTTGRTNADQRRLRRAAR